MNIKTIPLVHTIYKLHADGDILMVFHIDTWFLYENLKNGITTKHTKKAQIQFQSPAKPTSPRGNVRQQRHAESNVFFFFSTIAFLFVSFLFDLKASWVLDE